MKTDKEIAQKARERAKRQNEAAKARWVSVSCRLPLGTKERIQAQGYSINNFINNTVLRELERLEAEAPQTAQPEAAKEEQPEQAQTKTATPEDVAELNNWLHQIQQENEQRRLNTVQARQIEIESDR